MISDDGKAFKWKSPAGRWKCGNDAQRMMKMRGTNEYNTVQYLLHTSGWILKKLIYIEKQKMSRDENDWTNLRNLSQTMDETMTLHYLYMGYGTNHLPSVRVFLL